ncbi:hypothetical protein GH714_004511 [Hevea brasiliensis]|uniref:GH16 domain-containing protein n=1 Tax=Hevea brasiliensis TaxID=3981 RepID=A0A6A6LV97_HEVBR|nr:hypothetical protein GH714_004511 [Hevea brasiliensis]
MEIKLVAGNSAGTVTAYYLSSQGPYHDEIDFEFLGNLSGDPYTVHYLTSLHKGMEIESNSSTSGSTQQKIFTSTLLYGTPSIIFLVDNIPIRVYENEESIGIPFPKNQPMKLYSSLWNADQWATRGGLVKTDWSKAPFTAYYRNFNANACVWSSSAYAGNFSQDVDVTWGDGRGQMLDGGNLLSLMASGSGFQSKNKYRFGRFDVQMKLVPGNSAGTVTTFYVTN